MKTPFNITLLVMLFSMIKACFAFRFPTPASTSYPNYWKALHPSRFTLPKTPEILFPYTEDRSLPGSKPDPTPFIHNYYEMSPYCNPNSKALICLADLVVYNDFRGGTVMEVGYNVFTAEESGQVASQYLNVIKQKPDYYIDGFLQQLLTMVRSQYSRFGGQLCPIHNYILLQGYRNVMGRMPESCSRTQGHVCRQSEVIARC